MATNRWPSALRLLCSAILMAATALSHTACTGSKDSTIFSGILEPFTPPTPAQAARDAFNIYDPDTRRRAVQFLAAAPFGGEDAYVRTYRLLIDDADPTVRAACANALGLHGAPEDAALLIPLLSDRVSFVRWEAAQALQRIHNPAAIDPLLRVLRNPDEEDPDVRMAVATALGQYPTPAVFDALLGVLNDRDFAVVKAASQSLATLTGQDLGYDGYDWIDWAKNHRTDLFAHQQPYTYLPYVKPPTFIQKMKFWKDRPVAQPQAPAGLEAAAAQPNAASS
jgi:HEAT repeat protein